jgi:hypothetical protein
LEPIPVPDTLRGAHAVVTALRDREAIKNINGPARQRALRLIQALAAEAARRGYQVELARVETRPYTRRGGTAPDHFTISSGGHAIGIHIHQHHDRVKHIPTAAELVRQEKRPWERLPAHDSTPTERLGFQVSGRFQHRQSSWNDTSRTSLEETAGEWLSWAEQHVSRTDPLAGRLAMPADPDPAPEALKPFLRGWSPYGPDGHGYY